MKKIMPVFKYLMPNARSRPLNTYLQYMTSAEINMCPGNYGNM